MSRPFAKRVIVVKGHNITIDTDVDLVIRDISEDMDKVAAQMAWWGNVLAAAEGEKEEVEAQYRKWRGEKSIEVDPDFRAAEWKVKAVVEADDEFLNHKRRVARTIDNALAVKAMFMAYEKKANMLQSRGANQRVERGKAGGVRTYEKATSDEESSASGRPTGDIRGIVKRHSFE